MALNAASHNPTGTPTGSPSGPPPPTDSSLMDTIKKSESNDPTGQSVAGKDTHGNEDGQTFMGVAGKEKVPGEDTIGDGDVGEESGGGGGGGK